MNQTIQSGTRLREHIRRQLITPFIGIYDVFSASLAEDGSLLGAMTRDATLKTCNEVLLQNLNQRGT